MSASRRVVAVLLTLGLLSGCGVGGSVKSMLGLGKPLTSLRSLSVSADPGANRGNATQLDIVVTFNDNATASLPKTGPDWFRQRAALQSALANDIEVVSLQVPSASAAFEVKLPKRSNKGVAVYAYANYVSPQGWTPIALTPYKHAALRLQENAIAVSAK